MSSKKVIDLGDTVVCDMCNENYTGSDKEGGIIFGSNAVCPPCTARMMPDIEEYNEKQYIKAKCPEGVSFWRFVLGWRTAEYGEDGNKVIFYTE